MTLSVVASGPAMRPDNIPDELKALDRWVTFSVEQQRNGKPSKVPYVGATNQLAKANDPATWISYGAALQATEATGRYLGFAFTPELPYTFLDFDDVLGAGGAIKAYASVVIDTLDSYAEASISGRGVHVIVRGRPPERFTKQGVNGKVEVYPQSGGRFALLTGLTRPGLGNESALITEATEQLAVFFPAGPTHELRGGMFEPMQQPGDRLTDAEIAALTEAVRVARQPGQMHHVDLAWGGICAKNGVPEDQALHVIDVLSGGESKALNAVRDSYRRWAGGKDLSGYQELRGLMPADALETVDGILGQRWEARRPKIVTPGRARKLVAAGGDMAIDAFPAPPPDVFHGWFGGYLELVRDTTEAPDQFHLASALTIIGAYAGRRAHTKLASGRVYPNNFTVLVGNSSESKKDTAISRAWNMALSPEWTRTVTNPPYVERNGVASAEAFVKGLSTASNVVIRMSEFSELLANARRKGTTTILTMLMKAWDTPPQLSNDSLTNPALALNPYVSLLAGTQPDVLASDMIGTDISSGFANRIMFVPGSGKGPNPWPDEVDERRLHDHWLKVRHNIMAYSEGDYVPVNRTPAVVELWEQFYRAPRGETANERSMAQRHQNMALKVALIFAMSDCSETIEYQHLSRAIQWIDWSWTCVRQLMGGWATSNDNRLEERIVTVLARKGPIPRHVLRSATKDPRWTSNDFARLVDNMLRNQTLAIDSDTGRIGLNAETGGE